MLPANLNVPVKLNAVPLETSMIYIHACLLRLSIEKSKFELKWTSKDEFKGNYLETIWKIRNEIITLNKYVPMEAFVSRLIKFLQNRDTILLTEPEISLLAEFSEHSSSITVLEELQNKRGYDLSKEIEEHRTELKKIFDESDFGKIMENENLKDKFWFCLS